jgi:hypothetical protein
MDKMQTTLNTLQMKLEQQAFDVAVLNLWAHAKTHTGLEAEEVRAFTFRSDFLTKEEQKKNKGAKWTSKPPVYCDKNWHNALRLIDGRLIAMSGIARPIPPAWTPTQLQVKL